MKHSFKRVLSVTFFLVAGIAAFAQNVLVTGKVTDAATGEPVPGAAILVKGGTGGAVTDIDGAYAISVAPEATLVCSCIGYTETEQAVAGQTVINFALAVDAQMLEETVVVGYGTLKKSQR